VSQFIRVQGVESLNHGHARITFTNGEIRDMDLTAYIADGPILEPVGNDPAYFRTMLVACNTISWPNGADIDPDVLYYELGPNATEAEIERIVARR
jgi:hypothetical protein